MPQPATVAAPTGAVPAGPLTLAVQQGPRQGLGLLALALAPVQGALTFAVPGFEQSLRWDGALLGGVTSLAGFDAQGTLQLGYVNPGFAPGLQLLVAAAFLDQNGAVVGSTAVVPLTLGN